MPNKDAERRIDRLMTDATAALAETRYHDAERLAHEALLAAYAGGRFARMAQILLPLQEARRQRVELAHDAGPVRVVDAEICAAGLPTDGFWLVQPPHVAADARRLRADAIARGLRVAVLACEPLTKEGLCPVASIGLSVVRTRVEAPRRNGGKGVPSRTWFAAAMEALGDEAIASVAADLPPARCVTAFLDRLESMPDHEKLHQALADACRDAHLVPAPPAPPNGGLATDEDDDSELALLDEPDADSSGDSGRP